MTVPCISKHCREALNLKHDLLSQYAAEIIVAPWLYENSTIYIISPWISNFRCMLRGKIIPDLTSPNPCLIEFLKFIRSNNGETRILVRPLHSLISIEKIRFIQRMIEKNISDLPISTLIHDILAYRDMIQTLLEIFQKSLANVRFMERLHAKILATPYRAIIGSSNYTLSGLYGNVEVNVMLLGNDAKKIYDIAQRLWKSGKTLSDVRIMTNRLVRSLALVADKDPRLLKLKEILERLINLSSQ